MKKTTQIIGWIGAVILGLGLLSRLIQQRGSLFISLHLAIGGFLIAVAILSNLPDIRAFFARRIVRVGSGAFIRIFLLLIVLIMLNYLMIRHDFSFDLTSRSLYTLSRQTLDILEELPGSVQITAFFQPDRFSEARRRLELYRERSDKIKLDLIDPDRHPEVVAKKGIEFLEAGSIIFEYKGQTTLITQREEADITNALIKVTREESPVVYFLTGHGEADIEDKDKSGISILADALRHQNYRLEKLILAERVPEDAAALIIAGPRFPIPGTELDALDYFITQGGHVIFLLDPLFTRSYQPFITRLEPFLQGYGIIPASGIVVDPSFSYRRDVLGLSPICKEFQEHPVTQGLENKIVVFPQPRPLFQVTEGPEAGTWTDLVFTSDKSFLETNARELFEKQYIHFDAEDSHGPFVVTAVRSWKESLRGWERVPGKRREETRLVVVGNSLFLRNAYIETYSNFHFALNTINWLAGEEKMIHLQPKKRPASRIFLSQRQTDLIFYVSVLILPELLLILGVGIWWKKR
jgi:ABC-type uncharacterized transport system involved in gliding motility auxiliary subunit